MASEMDRKHAMADELKETGQRMLTANTHTHRPVASGEPGRSSPPPKTVVLANFSLFLLCDTLIAK